ARKKRIDVDVEKLIALDAERRKLGARVDEIRATLNRRGKEIAKLPPEQRSIAGGELQSLRDEEKRSEERVKALDAEIRPLHLRVPNVPAAEVPEGKDERENVEIRRVGEPPAFDFDPKDHVDLGKNLGLVDVERGVKVAGTRNYFLTGDGAL